MTHPRRVQRRVANEKSVINALEDAGCMVERQDWCDLTVQTQRGRIVLMEVKTDTGKLTNAQQELQDSGWMVHIVRSPEEALEIVREEDEAA